MKKDVLIAGCIGFFIGSIGALTVTHLPNLIQEVTKKQITKQTSLSPVPSIAQIVPKESLLSIDQPPDGSISDDKRIKISGKSQKGSVILIDTDWDSQIVESASDGTFSSNLTISEGANQIQVTSYNQDTENSKTITVFYTPEKL